MLNRLIMILWSWFKAGGLIVNSPVLVFKLAQSIGLSSLSMNEYWILTTFDNVVGVTQEKSICSTWGVLYSKLSIIIESKYTATADIPGLDITLFVIAKGVYGLGIMIG